jgi:hypothetical protein
MPCSIFYPVVREEIGDDDLMDEAAVEHGDARGYAITWTVLIVVRQSCRRSTVIP